MLDKQEDNPDPFSGNLKVSLKTGEKVLLDFRHYTYKELKLEGITILRGSLIRDNDGNEFEVHLIQIEAIILKDSEGNLYIYPKEEFINLIWREHEFRII